MHSDFESECAYQPEGWDEACLFAGLRYIHLRISRCWTVSTGTSTSGLVNAFIMRVPMEQKPTKAL